MRTGVQVRPPEPAKPLAIPKETAVLVNITTVAPPTVTRTYGNYLLPACKKGRREVWEAGVCVSTTKCEPGQEYAAVRIGAARDKIDYGEKRQSQFIVHAREIAMDLASECNENIWGIGSTPTGEIVLDPDTQETQTVRGFAGVFVADGELPTDAELAEARELLAASDAVLVVAGHATWDQFKVPNAIHEGFKRSARRLGVDAEWLYTVANLPNCPHCGSKLKSAKATVCATCHRDVVPQGTQNDAARSSPKKAASRKKAAAAA